jgi:hypothetical protein
MRYKVPESLKNKDIHFCELHNLLHDNFDRNKSKIVVLTDDHLSTETMFLPVEQRHTTVVEKIIAKTKQYLNCQFTIIHNCLNIDYQSENCKFINWAPEWITYHNKTEWINVLPQSEKNFEHDYFWICLNRNKRAHRYLTAMFLLGNNFEKQGLLTLTADEILEHGNFESWLYWWHHNQHNEINDIEKYFPILKKGFDKIKQKIGYQTNSYNSNENSSFITHNFEQRLRPLYVNTLIEVVNETIWQPDAGGVVTEKFVNSVYGFNLPIIIGVGNTVSYLKQLGFDLFDDVIDHSYDSEPSPTVRLTGALDKNKELFNNKHKSILAWKHCKSQMDYNINVLQTLEKNAEQRWIDLISHI